MYPSTFLENYKPHIRFLEKAHIAPLICAFEDEPHSFLNTTVNGKAEEILVKYKIIKGKTPGYDQLRNYITGALWAFADIGHELKKALDSYNDTYSPDAPLKTAAKLVESLNHQYQPTVHQTIAAIRVIMADMRINQLSTDIIAHLIQQNLPREHRCSEGAHAYKILGSIIRRAVDAHDKTTYKESPLGPDIIIPGLGEGRFWVLYQPEQELLKDIGRANWAFNLLGNHPDEALADMTRELQTFQAVSTR